MDYFIDIDTRCVVGVKADMCDLIVNESDDSQYLSIKTDGMGFSVSKSELLALIMNTVILDEVTGKE